MTTKRVQFNNIVQNQLPGYVKSDYPLVAEFLKSYYQGQEYEGGPIDLVQNIDKSMNALQSYTDAVSMSEGMRDLKKMIIKKKDYSQKRKNMMKMQLDLYLE